MERLERPISSDVLNEALWNMALDSTGRLIGLNDLNDPAEG